MGHVDYSTLISLNGDNVRKTARGKRAACGLRRPHPVDAACGLRAREPTRLLEPPGFLALHYGVRTPISVMVSHVVFGAMLGTFYTP